MSSPKFLSKLRNFLFDYSLQEDPVLQVNSHINLENELKELFTGIDKKIHSLTAKVPFVENDAANELRLSRAILKQLVFLTKMVLHDRLKAEVIDDELTKVSNDSSQYHSEIATMKTSHSNFQAEVGQLKFEFSRVVSRLNEFEKTTPELLNMDYRDMRSQLNYLDAEFANFRMMFAPILEKLMEKENGTNDNQEPKSSEGTP